MQGDKKPSRLERLKMQREALESRIRQIEARENSQKKKQDTRRKILIGAMIMDKLEREDGGLQSLMSDLDKFLSRSLDRELFNLPLTESA